MGEYINQIIQGDCLEVLRQFSDNSVDSVVTDPPYGISFMGKKWDYDVPQVEVWQEVLRVLKPGGHALVACGTRTQHRMAVNLEDAGFEIRDIVAWIYGSGFPKSLNIGKAVDKLQGNEREVIGKSNRHNSNAQSDIINPQGKGGIPDLTKGTSEWEGWGTALKPAMELWTLCRKPLEEKTVAENVLKYGTGGINIDGSRVEGITKHNNANGVFAHSGGGKEQDEYVLKNYTETYESNMGRFPANLIHDGSDEVVSLFPNTKSGSHKAGQPRNAERETSYVMPNITTYADRGSEGSASRFFYCAKASKSERNKGCEELEEKIGENGNKWTDQDYRRGDEKPTTARKNFHPTVKPVALMRYLCKLITPPKGIVLDPFTGSGSTGIGAREEGFNFIGIEKEGEYVKISEARLSATLSPLF